MTVGRTQNASLQNKIWIKALVHQTKTQIRQSKISNPITRKTQRQNPLSERAATLHVDFITSKVGLGLYTDSDGDERDPGWPEELVKKNYNGTFLAE